MRCHLVSGTTPGGVAFTHDSIVPWGMSPTRRDFISAVVGAAGASALGPIPGEAGTIAPPLAEPPTGFDPWIEVDPEALRANASAAAGLAGGRPVMAVIKNNAYGLGLIEVAQALDGHDGIAGFAVVKVAEAIALRDAGVRKPVLHMGTGTDAEVERMVTAGVRPSAFQSHDPARLERLAGRLDRRVPVHVYTDTGMRRMGIPAHRAGPWIEELVRAPVDVEGVFMAFTEEDDFDPEQLRRFMALTEAAAASGIDLGRRHAASSHGLFARPHAHLDMVRPGLVLYGAYPFGADRADASLSVALRVRARVVRVERLNVGDTVSYGAEWRADRPTWTATIPIGHADGYPRRAVDGCEALIGGALYPAVGAVSASHTIVILGDEAKVAVGDVATLVGPDDPAIHPNEISRRTGSSVYDVLMHLGQGLPRVVV
jgi:alanine racemase